jgi:hypothetical protein
VLRGRVFEVEALLSGHGEFQGGLLQLLWRHLGER